MVDISIVNGTINQLLTGGHHLVVYMFNYITIFIYYYLCYYIILYIYREKHIGLLSLSIFITMIICITILKSSH